MARNESVSFWNDPEDEDKIEDSLVVKKPKASFGEYFTPKKGFLERLVNPESEDNEDDNDSEKSKKKKQKRVGSSIFRSLAEEEDKPKKSDIQQAQEKIASIYEAKNNPPQSSVEQLATSESIDSDAVDNYEQNSAEIMDNIPGTDDPEAEDFSYDIAEVPEVAEEVPRTEDEEVINSPEKETFYESIDKMDDRKEEAPTTPAPPVAPPIIIQEISPPFGYGQYENTDSVLEPVLPQQSMPVSAGERGGYIPSDDSAEQNPTSNTHTVEKKSAVGALFAFIGADFLSRRRDKKLEKKIAKIEAKVPSKTEIEKVSKEVIDRHPANFKKSESVGQILQKEHGKYDQQPKNLGFAENPPRESRQSLATEGHKPKPKVEANTKREQNIVVPELIPAVFAGKKESLYSQKDQERSVLLERTKTQEVRINEQELKNEATGLHNKNNQSDKLTPSYYDAISHDTATSTKNSTLNITNNITIKSEPNPESMGIFDDPKKSVATGFITAIVILIVYIAFYIFR